MLVLQAMKIQKEYAARSILDFESFQVYAGDKIGIVGANGAGKSTLLQILSGELAPDSGKVDRRCKAVLLRQFDEREESRSGGENRKRIISERMSGDNLIVFADEPTANLDADGLRWITRKLQNADTLLLVSHDRELLDTLCSRIVEIKDGKLREFTGNYSDYENTLEKERQAQQVQHEQYKRKKAQLERAIATQEHAVASQRQSKRRQYAKNSSEARLGGHKRAAIYQKIERQAKAMETNLNRLQEVEKLKEAPRININFSLTQPPGNKIVLRCENLYFAYGDNPVLDHAAFVVRRGEKVALTGKNGAGKSTLLNLIYRGYPGIVPVPKLRMGFLHQNFEDLDMGATLLENVLSVSVQQLSDVRSILAGLLFRGDDVYKRAGALSGGELVRLSLARLLASPANALLLDEPTNFLDIPSLQAVQQTLADYPGTLLMVSHDSRFVNAIATARLHLEDGKVTEQAAVSDRPAAVPSRMLLEMRRTELVAAIGAAPPEQKDKLEQEYHQVLEQLRQLD